MQYPLARLSCERCEPNALVDLERALVSLFNGRLVKERYELLKAKFLALPSLLCTLFLCSLGQLLDKLVNCS